MDRRAAEHTTQTIHRRLTTTLPSQGPDYARECTERIRTTLGLGAVRHLARYRRPSQRSRCPVDQGREVRAELDSAVVPSIRGQPGASVSVRPGVQPWELPSPTVSAQGVQALVAAERAGQADQDGRPSGAALPAVDLPVIRGVGSSTVVRGSVGSYRPVITGTKLREGITTILPRGGERSRESPCLQSGFTTLAGDTKTTKMAKKHGSRQETHL